MKSLTDVIARSGKTRQPSESEEQKAVFEWAAAFERVYPELFLLAAIPNGGYRNPREAARLRAEGVKAGVPDMILFVARGGYHGLAIEMKRQRAYKISPKQICWMRRMSEQGWYAVVCQGAVQAQNIITKYLLGQIVV